MKIISLHTNSKRILSIAVIIFIAITFLMSVNTFAFTCSLCGQEHKSLTYPKKQAYNLYAEIFSGNIFYSENAGGTITTEDILKFDTNSSHFSTLWSQAESFYNVVKVFGELLCIIYTMLKIIEHITADSMNPEKIVLIIMKMVIGLIVLKNGFDIIMAGMTLATVAFNNLSGTSFTTTTNNVNCIYNEIANADFWQSFGYIFETVFVSFAMSIAKFIISIVCWMRLLDIVIRAVFAPVGMANIIQDGMHGSGFNYMKKLIASALQGAIILGLVRGYGVIAGMLPGGSMISKLVLVYSLVTIVFKSSQIAEDVMGA